MSHSCLLVCAIVAAVLILDAAHARPSPEAALSGGYSYAPPNGPRFGPHQSSWRGRSASEVSIERVPLRLVHQSASYPSGPARRGPFQFPTGGGGRHLESPQRHRFVFPSGPAEQFARNDLYRDQPQVRNDLSYPTGPRRDSYLPPSTTTTANMGYSYDPPATTTQEIPTTTTTATEVPTTQSDNDNKPRIAIAISKSTVIHTGKGSFEIDEKTGLPRPIVAEAHSTAILPEPSASTNKPGDNLKGEGTGSFPIITKGTPPRDEEPITESQDPITEPATTATMDDMTTTPASATASNDASPFATSWPHAGQQSYSVIAPGQAQFVSLGHVNPGVVSFGQGNHFVPTFIQPELAHPTYRSAYHPFAASAPAAYYPYFQHFVTPYANVVEYAQEQPDLCRGKVVPQFLPHAAAVVPHASTVVPQAAAVVPQAAAVVPQAVPVAKETKPGRIVITKGGIAIAGPGGFADSGEGGTSIVGPGGTVYSSPNGVSVVGPGGKVVMQADGTERILARGPIIYYHQP